MSREHQYKMAASVIFALYAIVTVVDAANPSHSVSSIWRRNSETGSRHGMSSIWRKRGRNNLSAIWKKDDAASNSAEADVTDRIWLTPISHVADDDNLQAPAGYEGATREDNDVEKRGRNTMSIWKKMSPYKAYSAIWKRNQDSSNFYFQRPLRKSINREAKCKSNAIHFDFCFLCGADCEDAGVYYDCCAGQKLAVDFCKKWLLK
ncbi:uncharacterized protein LOC106162677 [Lingula anatina]|uniref:Uncharacterized protein LOC106162677 n=1 Tax=Lingula anatina TaxID=7574 RepID=A0A1S3IB44_LINAN|nr:uncharacterized protein LOC106162677 [Lingula anatina]|eukprot:XP_013395482.1 uncharacterized protein LOC106162677 [Lingula anatina]